MKVKCECLICKKVFYLFPSTVKAGQGKYCSIKCKHKRLYSAEERRKMGTYSWKGGRVNDGNGYIRLWQPHHPFANNLGYVFEHRLIMEKYIGRFLTKDEIVHHINNIRNDNRIENLRLFSSRKEHVKFHWSIK